jgi:hypothetical protein
MDNEKIELMIINVPVKDFAKLNKIIENVEVISMFVKNHGSRYKIRNKVDDILSKYFSEIQLLLPFPAKKRLHKKLMKVLSFFLLYFYIYIVITIINIIICLLDSVNDYDSKRNTEIMKCDGKVNGIIGMKRDANLQLLVFFHSYDDIRAVLIN